jgi:isopentenyldiphosphate isomerase
MKEMLDTFSADGKLIGQVEKKESHEQMREEFFKTGSISTRHRHVRLLLMTSKGHLILQRRSKWKGDNPGLWDKTVGGHVTAGYDFDLTVLKECAEELGIPSTVVEENAFNNTVVATNLDILGVLRKLNLVTNDKSSRKVKNGKKWIEAGISQYYIGYYDGAIRFIDKEACGIQLFSKKELLEELKNNPKDFTDDLHYIFSKYANLIKSIEKKTSHVQND